MKPARSPKGRNSGVKRRLRFPLCVPLCERGRENSDAEENQRSFRVAIPVESEIRETIGGTRKRALLNKLQRQRLRQLVLGCIGTKLIWREKATAPAFLFCFSAQRSSPGGRLGRESEARGVVGRPGVEGQRGPRAPRRRGPAARVERLGLDLVIRPVAVAAPQVDS